MNKVALKEELVDLRMKLAEAENQALKVTKQLVFAFNPYEYGLINRAYHDIRSADNKLCELAKLLGLDKLDLVKPGKGNK